MPLSGVNDGCVGPGVVGGQGVHQAPGLQGLPPSLHLLARPSPSRQDIPTGARTRDRQEVASKQHRSNGDQRNAERLHYCCRSKANLTEKSAALPCRQEGGGQAILVFAASTLDLEGTKPQISSKIAGSSSSSSSSSCNIALRTAFPGHARKNRLGKQTAANNVQKRQARRARARGLSAAAANGKKHYWILQQPHYSTPPRKEAKVDHSGRSNSSPVESKPMGSFLLDGNQDGNGDVTYPGGAMLGLSRPTHSSV